MLEFGLIRAWARLELRCYVSRGTTEAILILAIMDPEPGLIGGAGLAIVEASGTRLHTLRALI
ncbi:hypothetical protein [Luteibacter sp. UNC138MFCol5.1]|uniref:hypothetical protein n=1 Tax=Luteibacter sp. UNC138MFCol5.1 TaxID=1502774 RepID=UPI000B7FBF39|nr:hypothetical protein [Luteibacter sp. UNC138MFCol5.1]